MLKELYIVVLSQKSSNPFLKSIEATLFGINFTFEFLNIIYKNTS